MASPAGEILVPDPSLVVLVGAAGSGKSTFARRHFAPDEILSSDALRARLTGDEADQRVSGLVFSILHRELRRRLAAGRLTVVDATSVRRRARRELLVEARLALVPAIAIVLDLPLEVLLRRNALRTRVVDENVIRRQAASLRVSLQPPGLTAEGFTLVARIEWPGQLETVRVKRLQGKL